MHAESEDPTLIHQPHDESNEVLKAKVLQIVGRTFDVSSPHQFPCQPSSLRNLHELVYVVKSALQQQRNRFQTYYSILKNCRRIQTVFETVQTQISNLGLRDHEVYGLPNKWIGQTVPGGSIRYFTDENAFGSASWWKLS